MSARAGDFRRWEQALNILALVTFLRGEIDESMSLYRQARGHIAYINK